MVERLTKLLALGNLLEAGLWLVFALLFFVMAMRCTQRKRRLWLIVAVAFVAFGISDVIESQTGAWWKPPWLLALKGGCICVFLYGFWEYRRLHSVEPQPPAARPADPTIAPQADSLPSELI